MFGLCCLANGFLKSDGCVALGVQFLYDIFPWDSLMVKDERFSVGEEHRFRQTHVWVAPAGTVTPAHFDVYHNFFAQLHGRKRFLLFPPSAWQQLYLYPILHPGGRSSQVNLDVPPRAEEAESTFPYYFAQELRGLQAELNPGDVLYIPPLWFHHVTALEQSTSVSIWSPYAGSELDALALEAQLPIRRTWTHAQRVAALRLFLVSVIERLEPLAGMTAAEFVFIALLDTRYKHISLVDEEEKNAGLFCFDPEARDAVLLEGGDDLLHKVGWAEITLQGAFGDGPVAPFGWVLIFRSYLLGTLGSLPGGGYLHQARPVRR